MPNSPIMFTQTMRLHLQGGGGRGFGCGGWAGGSGG